MKQTTFDDASNTTRMAHHNDHSPTFIEVCAGGGGLSAGLIKAGFTPLLLNDNDKKCCDTLRLNHPGVDVVHAGMEDIDLSPYRGRVDLLTGGVPCQSFSQAGKRGGLEDPRGNLMFRFVELVEVVQPRIFMIENVRGLLTHNRGQTFAQIVAAFDHTLYEITHKVLYAVRHNVPQKRERVVVIGLRRDAHLTFRFPEESDVVRTVGEALQDVPDSPGSAYSEEKIRLFRQIPQGGCWVNLPEDQQRAYLGGSFESGGGKRGILYRLSNAKPSLTLLCSPSQKQTERCHPTEERPLTVREYARIQTFDDSYQFVGSIASQYRQIGNAVPVELARQLGVEFMRTLQ